LFGSFANANALHNAFAAKFKVNFGFLGCFDAANPIIAPRRSTCFSRNVIFISPVQNISTSWESVYCKYFLPGACPQHQLCFEPKVQHFWWFFAHFIHEDESFTIFLTLIHSIQQVPKISFNFIESKGPSTLISRIAVLQIFAGI